MNDNLTPKRYTLDEILEEARARRKKVTGKLSSQDAEMSYTDQDIDQILQSISKAAEKSTKPDSSNEVAAQKAEDKKALADKTIPNPRLSDRPTQQKSPVKQDSTRDTSSPFATFAKKQKEKFNEEEFFENIKTKPKAAPSKEETPKEKVISPIEKAKLTLSTQEKEENTNNQTIAKTPTPIVLNAKPQEHTEPSRQFGSKKVTLPIYKKQTEEDSPPQTTQHSKSTSSDTDKFHTKVLDDNLIQTANPIKTEDLPNLQAQTLKTEEDWERELQKKRVKKISNFVLSGEEEEESDTIDWEREELPEIEDYEQPEDAPSIRNALNKEIYSLVFRSVITFLTTATLLLLLILPMIGISLPDILFPDEPYLALLIMHTGLVLISILASAPTVFGGLTSLLSFKPTGDSAPAAASVSVLIQSALMLFNSTSYQNTNHLFGSVVSLSLFINSMGKLFMVRRIRRNFDFVADNTDKISAAILQDKELAQNIGRGVVIGGSVVAYPARTKFLTRFIDTSYREDYSQTTAQLLALLGFLGSIAAVLVNIFLMNQANSPITALSLLSASLCICIPIGSLLSSNMQLNSLSKSLKSQKALMTGFTTAEDFNQVNAIAISASDLFPESAVRLHGIKTFSGQRIDDAILDAAALVCSMGGPMADIFDVVIQGRRDILPEVDSLVYEEEMGVSGWVAGRRVLVGSRRLMINHGIDVPSSDYEARYLRNDRNIVYLSTSGELSAMFIVSYLFSKKTGAALRMLDKEGAAIIVSTTDPNITPSMLSQGFEIPENSIKIMSPAESREYSNLRNTPPEKMEAGIAYKGSISGFIRAITGAMRLNSNIRLISILQTISILIGYGVVLFFALTTGLSHINTLQILSYQIFWILAIVFVPMLRKP